MRYAASAYGEDAIVFGEFVTGSTVTCVIYDGLTRTVIPTTNGVTNEILTTGVFTYELSKIVTKPTTFTQILYIMTDSSTGRTHKGKGVIGGYPSDSAISRYENAVHIDTTGAGTAGTAFPIGTPQVPVSNLANAITIAAAVGVASYHIRGAITLTTNHDNWEFVGFDPNQDIVTVTAGVSVDVTGFNRVKILGDLTGELSAIQCIFGAGAGTVTGLKGTFYDCGFQGTIKLADGGFINALGMNSTSLTGAILDFDTPTVLMSVLTNAMAGYWTIKNANVFSVIGAVLKGGNLTFDSTNVNMGGAHLYGYGEAEYSNATFFSGITDFVLRGSNLDVAVSTVSGAAAWDELLTAHTTVNTFGWFVQKLLTVAKFLGLK